MVLLSFSSIGDFVLHLLIRSGRRDVSIREYFFEAFFAEPAGKARGKQAAVQREKTCKIRRITKKMH